jgi:hypothetical protein
MSQYLISRIDRSPHITLYTDSEIETLKGDLALECVTWTNRKTGEKEGAEAYLKDLPKAQLYLLDTSHFALEEELEFIADKMKEFLG